MTHPLPWRPQPKGPFLGPPLLLQGLRRKLLPPPTCPEAIGQVENLLSPAEPRHSRLIRNPRFSVHSTGNTVLGQRPKHTDKSTGLSTRQCRHSRRETEAGASGFWLKGQYTLISGTWQSGMCFTGTMLCNMEAVAVGYTVASRTGASLSGAIISEAPAWHAAHWHTRT